MKRDFGPLQHFEQLGLVGVESFEQAVGVTKPVWRVKMRSNRAIKEALRFSDGARR